MSQCPAETSLVIQVKFLNTENTGSDCSMFSQGELDPRGNGHAVTKALKAESEI